MREDTRSYDLLGYLNLKPRTFYLARIRNHNPAITPVEVHGGHGGGHDAGHEADIHNVDEHNSGGHDGHSHG